MVARRIVEELRVEEWVRGLILILPLRTLRCIEGRGI
jgi:hypothetical protein